jgi:LmbE family N-acetylglucosaminyl deacetylase
MRILAIGPHSDDIELGCGATLARATESYNSVIDYVVFSPGYNNPDIKQECAKASIEIGVKPEHFHFNTFSARHLHASRQEILNILIEEGKEFKPDLIIGPSVHDIHQDHSVVAHEMVRAFKDRPIFSYLLPWNSVADSRQGSIFVRIKRCCLDAKIKALSMYQSQKERTYMSAAAVEAQAKYNGLIAHCEFAERFDAVRFPI